MQCGKHPATSIGAGHGTRSFTSSRCFGCNENKGFLRSKGHQLDNFLNSTKSPWVIQMLKKLTWVLLQKWSSWVGCLFRILRGLLNNNAWTNEAQGRFLIADIAGMGSTFDAFTSFTVEKGDLRQTVRLLSNWLFLEVKSPEKRSNVRIYMISDVHPKLLVKSIVFAACNEQTLFFLLCDRRATNNKLVVLTKAM